MDRFLQKHRTAFLCLLSVICTLAFAIPWRDQVMKERYREEVAQARKEAQQATAQQAMPSQHSAAVQQAKQQAKQQAERAREAQRQAEHYRKELEKAQEVIDTAYRDGERGKIARVHVMYAGGAEVVNFRARDAQWFTGGKWIKACIHVGRDTKTHKMWCGDLGRY